MGGQFLNLSLFIVLLSFFIMLNAMSTFEKDKSKTVLKSIEFAFSSSPITHDVAPTIEEAPEEEEKEGDSLDKLQDLFENQIAGIQARKNRLGTELHIQLPAEALERAVMQSPTEAPPSQAEGAPPIGDFFLPTLISLMQSDAQGVSYRMDMVLNMPDNPAKMHNDGAGDVEAGKRMMSKVAEVIESAGMPKKLFSPGLSQGRVGYADLYFRRYVPYNPLGVQE